VSIGLYSLSLLESRFMVSMMPVLAMIFGESVGVHGVIDACFNHDLWC
jgi:hypothetical protein